jgi:hypothetical protein
MLRHNRRILSSDPATVKRNPLAKESLDTTLCEGMACPRILTGQFKLRK